MPLRLSGLLHEAFSLFDQTSHGVEKPHLGESHPLPPVSSDGGVEEAKKGYRVIVGLWTRYQSR